MLVCRKYIECFLKRDIPLSFLGCEIDEKCSDDSIPYKVVSGDGIDKYPIICFNNKLYVFLVDDDCILLKILFRRLVHKNLKDSKIGRGVNLVALDGKTYELKLTETFDTYIEGK